MRVASGVIRRRHFAMMRPAVVRVPVYIPYPQLGLLPRAYAIPSSAVPTRANRASSAELAGPTDNSNWVLPGAYRGYCYLYADASGRLLVGGWPGDSREALHLTMLHALLKAGTGTAGWNESISDFSLRYYLNH